MTISPGARLGPYEVVAPIGAGGMGEVFKARDTRLDRSVAIKILPGEFARDARLRSRFEREAKTISQLNHPHICTVYDVGENYLVMELLEGETLADRIGRGPLPIDHVLRYGIEIAEALDRAHRAGVVHRDLKPSNIMITKSGAKLLDFGLAKTGVTVAGGLSGVTEQKPLTEEGAIVGTIQYMAPEQLEGADADARTDIFALGQVLYEMATGRRAFSGKTRTSLIASIMAAEPQAITSLQPITPASFEAIVTRSLAKDPDNRWQCAADLRWELVRVAQERPSTRSTRSTTVLPWLIAAVALIGAGFAAFIASRPRLAVPSLSRFTFEAPPGWISVTELKSGPPAISPDGRAIVFVATHALSGKRALWLRRIDDVTPRIIEGTDEASRPFWSPDGRSIAFFADNNNKVKRVDVAGGPPQLICDTQNGRGGSWGVGGVIIFAPLPFSHLMRVDAGGGTPVPLTKLNAADHENSHRWPSFLPDGKHFFFDVRRLIPDAPTAVQDQIYVGDVDSGSRKFVMTTSSNVMYCDPGWIVFARDRTLFAQRFDLRRLEVTGEPIPIASQLQFHPSGFGMFSASNTALVYQAGTNRARLELYDRATNKTTPLLDAEDEYSFPRFSKDEQQVVYDLAERNSGSQDIWLFDRARKVTRRLTTNAADDFSAQLTPDGTRFYFSSNRSGTPQIGVKSVDGGEEKVVRPAGRKAEFVQSLSPDEKSLAIVSLGPSQNDIEIVSLADGSSKPFSVSQFDELQPQFSPDGRFLAFTSNETGRYEVYVAPFPAAVPHIQISTEGGTQPTWRGDGREMYYVDASGKLMSVPIDPSGRLKAGAPVAITNVTLRPSRNMMREYDVSADGKTFLLNSTGAASSSVPFTVEQNWIEDLRRRRAD